MQKFLTILSWVFSMLMLIATIGAFADGHYLAGVFCILIVACAFPPLWAFLKTKNITAPLWAKWVAVFVLFGCFGAAMPTVNTPPSTETTTKKESQKPNTVKATPEQLNASARSFMNEIIAAAKTCDDYGKAFAAQAETLDMMAWYQIARAGKEACYDASSNLSKIKAPDVYTDATRKELDKAIDQMSTAYFVRGEAFKKFEKIADGDMRPSVITDAKETINRAQSGQILSMAGIFTALGAEGVDTGTLASDGSPE